MCVSRMLPQQLAMRGKVGWVDPSVCNAAEVVAARNGNGRGQSGCSLGSRTQKSVVQKIKWESVICAQGALQSIHARHGSRLFERRT